MKDSTTFYTTIVKAAESGGEGLMPNGNPQSNTTWLFCNSRSLLEHLNKTMSAPSHKFEYFLKTKCCCKTLKWRTQVSGNQVGGASGDNSLIESMQSPGAQRVVTSTLENPHVVRHSCSSECSKWEQVDLGNSHGVLTRFDGQRDDVQWSTKHLLQQHFQQWSQLWDPVENGNNQ